VGGRLLWRAKQAEAGAARLALDARYTAARQTSIDGYLVLDEDGRVVEVNAALLRMTGFAHEELLKRPIRELQADSGSWLVPGVGGGSGKWGWRAAYPLAAQGRQ